VRYEVTLQSYRGSQKTIEGELKIPEKFQGGEVKVWAVPASELVSIGAYREGWIRPMPSVNSFEDLIQDAQELAKGVNLYVFLDGIPQAIWNDYLDRSSCEYIDCLANYRDIENIEEFDLKGAVSGFDYWPIMVQD
jgi:hypothetical protein